MAPVLRPAFCGSGIAPLFDVEGPRLLCRPTAGDRGVDGLGHAQRHGLAGALVGVAQPDQLLCALFRDGGSAGEASSGYPGIRAGAPRFPDPVGLGDSVFDPEPVDPVGARFVVPGAARIVVVRIGHHFVSFAVHGVAAVDGLLQIEAAAAFGKAVLQPLSDAHDCDHPLRYFPRPGHPAGNGAVVFAAVRFAGGVSMAETRRNQVPQIVEPFQEIDGQPTPSIIVPCHNEEEMVPIFHKEIAAVSDQLSDAAFELIFVNDGSKDATLAELKRLAAVDQRVHYLSFSRGSSTI